MYLKRELRWNVVLHPESLKRDTLKNQMEVSRCLLYDFATKKATKDLGYFLAVTTMESVGEGIVRPDTGEVKFPVVFSCISFKLFCGEIIDGVVHKVRRQGVCLRCGPIENVFLPANKIPDYQFITGEDESSVYLNPEKKLSRIGIDVTIRCVFIASRRIEAEREFYALVDLPDDNV